jgi:hypothetical protein
MVEPMLTLVFWWSAIILEFVILLRGFQQKTLAKYPFFYLYIASLLFSDGPLFLVYLTHPLAYPKWNWNAGFINIILGCGILLEIFRHVLTPYPGAERFARISTIIIFVVIFSFGVGYLIFAPNTFESRLLSRLERDLLAVQAVFLTSLIAVICYYGIAMGRNVQGMVVGYGLCIGTTLMMLAMRSFTGQQLNSVWILVQPFTYVVCLAIWSGALWRSQPDPGPSADSALESDYESVVELTKSAMGTMRSHLERAARP